MRRAFAPLAALAALLAACSDAPPPGCRVGADCASGACSRDGRCVSPESPDAGGLDAGATDAGATDAGATDAGATDAGPGGCLPDADGRLDRSEVPTGPGLRATYRVGAGVEVDTAGAEGEGGRRRWDFTAALAAAERVEVRTESPAGRWFSADFPTATYVSRLAEASELLGVFEVTDGALRLLGVVSPTDAPATLTRLIYDPPVDVLRFPLAAGDRWEVSSWVTGTFEGLFLGLGYPERYTYEVDGEGDLLVPYSDRPFPVLRLSVERVTVIGVLVTTLRTRSFLAECFGPVAAATSAENERSVDFTAAAELRGLAP